MNFYELLIRESHLDTFGHVNNATYLQIYEEARWEIITQNGYGFSEVHKLKQGPIILDLEMKFLKELKLRQKIKITLEVIQYQGKTGKLKQQMLSSEGTVVNEMVMTFGLFDLSMRKLIEPTVAWKKALGIAKSQ